MLATTINPKPHGVHLLGITRRHSTRKAHTCHNCMCKISIGDQYWIARLINPGNGQYQSMKFCSDCGLEARREW